MDYVKLERELVNLSKTLPEAPQWAAISTTDGVFLRQYPTHLDGDKIAALTTLHAHEAGRMLHKLDNGTFTYSITSGSTGIYIVFLIADRFLLGFDFKQLHSIDGVLKTVQANLNPLLVELDAV